MVKLVIAFLFFTFSVVALSHHTTEHSIQQRIKPVGEVRIAGEKAPSVGEATTQVAAKGLGQPPKAIYQSFCFACHATGAANAPKLEKAAWVKRRQQGIDSLVSHVVKGLNLMPPKGTCMNCSDEEIRQTVEWMLENLK